MSSYSLSSSPSNEPPTRQEKWLYSQPSATTSSIGSSIPFHHLKHLNQSMVSGAGAGLISSVVTCPLDVLKTRLQAQEIGRGKVGYEGVLATARQIFAQAGIRGFYRGLGPTILGYLPTWAIYFSVYDEVKSRLAANETGKKPVIWLHIVAAMTAGATGTIVTNPLWLIKTRFMTQNLNNGDKKYRHTVDAIRTIYRTEGLKAFYKGLTPSLMGVSHVAVQFPLYEQLKIWAAPEYGAPLPSHIILLCSALSKMVASLTTYPHEVVRTRLQIQRASSSPHPHTPPPQPLSAMSPSSSTPPPHSSPPIPTPAVAASPLVAGEAVPHVRVGGGLGVRQGVTSYKGFNQTVKKIYKEGGWKGFYRGLSINLVRTVPSSAATMLTYELIMQYLTRLNNGEHDP
ncbi:mitochondrial carrier domain-containing protein [Mrakia frigida]|uniref:mitochondrial carrier domain-containing protein n=1 Tax=Mrakia frigida TaxID=29902 RepID=UPI003FCC1357